MGPEPAFEAAAEAAAEVVLGAAGADAAFDGAPELGDAGLAAPPQAVRTNATASNGGTTRRREPLLVHVIAALLLVGGTILRH
ncbi:MAG: hypothetical protein JOZ39_08355 [Chloroflexi bacterium]|nr:hypothetical protein [Chloroflexota bacterium]